MKTLTTTQVANLCAVSRMTVLKWINSGVLKSNKLPSGHNRVLVEKYNEFAEKYNMPKVEV